jgi:TolA-binding protein
MKRLGLALLLAGCGGGDAQRIERIETDRVYAEAERAFSRGDPRAVELFESFIARAGDPADRALALYRLAQLHEKAGRWDEADAAYARVVETGVYERAALAEMRRGVIAVEQGRPGGEARLRGVAERWPDSAAADKTLRYLAVTSDRRFPDPAADRDLVAWMRSLVERFPDRKVADNAQFWTGWVQVFRIGDVGGARRTLRAFVARWPESPVLDPVVALLAGLYQRTGEWRLAADVYATLPRLHETAKYWFGEFRTPALDDAANMVGVLLYHGERDLDGAEAAWRDLLDRFANSRTRDDAWWGLANIAYEEGNRDEAHALLRALLADAPDSRYAKRARALLEGGDEAALRDPPDPAKVRSPLAKPDASGNL